jgi:hypothetical protein
MTLGSTLRAAIMLLAAAPVAGTAPPPTLSAPTPRAGQGWELVRSVTSPFGGSIDLVLVPKQRESDRPYYQTVADVICGSRTSCMVHFWTDRAHVPTSASMPVTDLRVMTATYERAPSYKAPSLRLACWLYPSKKTAEASGCFYMPGAVMPWDTTH